MGSLYGKKKVNAVNKKRDGTDINLTGLGNTPYQTRDTYPERSIKFKNARAVKEDYNQFLRALTYVSNTNIPTTELPSINSGKYAPIFLGSPGDPDPEFLYDNPEIINESAFFVESDLECEKVWLFAHIQSYRQRNQRDTSGDQSRRQGGSRLPNVLELEGLIPYSTPGVTPTETGLGIMTVDQGGTGGRAPIIKINSIAVNVRNCENSCGESIIAGFKDHDTWYKKPFFPLNEEGEPDYTQEPEIIGGGWEQNSNSLNSGIGAGRILDANGDRIFLSGERLTWSFGTIWFFRGIGPGYVPGKMNPYDGFGQTFNEPRCEVPGISGDIVAPDGFKLIGDFTLTGWGGVQPAWANCDSICPNGKTSDIAVKQEIRSWDYEGIVNSQLGFCGLNINDPTIYTETINGEGSCDIKAPYANLFGELEYDTASGYSYVVPFSAEFQLYYDAYLINTENYDVIIQSVDAEIVQSGWVNFPNPPFGEGHEQGYVSIEKHDTYFIITLPNEAERGTLQWNVIETSSSCVNTSIVSSEVGVAALLPPFNVVDDDILDYIGSNDVVVMFNENLQNYYNDVIQTIDNYEVIIDSINDVSGNSSWSGSIVIQKFDDRVVMSFPPLANRGTFHYRMIDRTPNQVESDRGVAFSNEIGNDIEKRYDTSTWSVDSNGVSNFGLRPFVNDCGENSFRNWSEDLLVGIESPNPCGTASMGETDVSVGGKNSCDGIVYDYSNQCEIKLSTYWYEAISVGKGGSLYQYGSVPNKSRGLLRVTSKQYEARSEGRCDQIYNDLPFQPDIYGRACFSFIFNCIDEGDCIRVKHENCSITINWAPEKNWDLCCCPLSSSSESSSQNEDDSGCKAVQYKICRYEFDCDKVEWVEVEPGPDELVNVLFDAELPANFQINKVQQGKKYQLERLAIPLQDVICDITENVNMNITNEQIGNVLPPGATEEQISEYKTKLAAVASEVGADTIEYFEDGNTIEFCIGDCCKTWSQGDPATNVDNQAAIDALAEELANSCGCNYTLQCVDFTFANENKRIASIWDSDEFEMVDSENCKAELLIKVTDLIKIEDIISCPEEGQNEENKCDDPVGIWANNPNCPEVIDGDTVNNDTLDGEGCCCGCYDTYEVQYDCGTNDWKILLDGNDNPILDENDNPEQVELVDSSCYDKLKVSLVGKGWRTVDDCTMRILVEGTDPCQGADVDSCEEDFCNTEGSSEIPDPPDIPNGMPAECCCNFWVYKLCEWEWDCDTEEYVLQNSEYLYISNEIQNNEIDFDEFLIGKKYTFKGDATRYIICDNGEFSCVTLQEDGNGPKESIYKKKIKSENSDCWMTRIEKVGQFGIDNTQDPVVNTIGNFFDANSCPDLVPIDAISCVYSSDFPDTEPDGCCDECKVWVYQKCSYDWDCNESKWVENNNGDPTVYYTKDKIIDGEGGLAFDQWLYGNDFSIEDNNDNSPTEVYCVDGGVLCFPPNILPDPLTPNYTKIADIKKKKVSKSVNLCVAEYWIRLGEYSVEDIWECDVENNFSVKNDFTENEIKYCVAPEQSDGPPPDCCCDFYVYQLCAWDWDCDTEEWVSDSSSNDYFIINEEIEDGENGIDIDAFNIGKKFSIIGDAGSNKIYCTGTGSETSIVCETTAPEGSTVFEIDKKKVKSTNSPCRAEYWAFIGHYTNPEDFFNVEDCPNLQPQDGELKSCDDYESSLPDGSPEGCCDCKVHLYKICEWEWDCDEEKWNKVVDTFSALYDDQIPDEDLPEMETYIEGKTYLLKGTSNPTIMLQCEKESGDTRCIEGLQEVEDAIMSPSPDFTNLKNIDTVAYSPNGPSTSTDDPCVVSYYEYLGEYALKSLITINDCENGDFESNYPEEECDYDIKTEVTTPPVGCCTVCTYLWSSEYDCDSEVWGSPTKHSSVLCVDSDVVGTGLAWTSDADSINSKLGVGEDETDIVEQTGCLAWYISVGGVCTVSSDCPDYGESEAPTTPDTPEIDSPITCCPRCVHTFSSTWSCASSVWSEVSYISTECEMCSDDNIDTWIATDDPCVAIYKECGVECKPSDETPCTSVPNSEDYPNKPTISQGLCCAACQYVWWSRYDCDTTTWSTPILNVKVCGEDGCTAVDWTSTKPSLANGGPEDDDTCVRWSVTCGAACKDGVCADVTAPAGPTDTPDTSCCEKKCGYLYESTFENCPTVCPPSESESETTADWSTPTLIDEGCWTYCADWTDDADYINKITGGSVSQVDENGSSPSSGGCKKWKIVCADDCTDNADCDCAETDSAQTPTISLSSLGFTEFVFDNFSVDVSNFINIDDSGLYDLITELSITNGVISIDLSLDGINGPTSNIKVTNVHCQGVQNITQFNNTPIPKIVIDSVHKDLDSIYIECEVNGNYVLCVVPFVI